MSARTPIAAKEPIWLTVSVHSVVPHAATTYDTKVAIQSKLASPTAWANGTLLRTPCCLSLDIVLSLLFPNNLSPHLDELGAPHKVHLYVGKAFMAVKLLDLRLVGLEHVVGRAAAR